MNADYIVTKFIEFASLFAKPAERKIGYKLILHDLSPHWINTTFAYDMTAVWKKGGLDAEGVNYFTIGAIKKGVSERFNPESPYYQSWFGGYLVKFPNPRTWTVEKHYQLGVEDQKNWLRMFGNANPYVKVDVDTTKTIGQVTISGYSGVMYEGSFWSNTDVGNRNPTIPFVNKPWNVQSFLQLIKRYIFTDISQLLKLRLISKQFYIQMALYTKTKTEKVITPVIKFKTN